MKQYKDIITWEDKMESKAERIKQRTIKTIKRTWRPRTAVIAAFLMLTTLIPVLGGCSSPSSQEQQVPQVDQTPSTASLHEGEMDNLKALLANAGSLTPAELRASLTAVKENIASLNSQMEEEFAGTTEVLNRLDLPEKMQIHQDVMAQFQDSKDRLNTALDETIASTDADIAPRAASLYGLVSELSPEEESQPLGTELPNQLIERDPVAPVLGANIAPAYLAGAPDLTPSDLPVEPTPEDLAPTIDAQHSQEIIDKAAELENDPVKIYEWVRNNIDFEPYYGSKKGATETLAEMAGNDMDTASLLIALYRVSGIPARYVTGVIEITADQAMKWTATEVPEAALRLFASGGTPITSIKESGQITRIQLNHTYCEAYVNYSNYRGFSADEVLKKWMPLDVSYKEYELSTTTLALHDIGMGTTESWMNQYLDSAQQGTNSLTGMDFNLLKDGFFATRDQIDSEMRDLLSETDKNEMLRAAVVIELELGYLPTCLTYQMVSNLNEARDIPEELRYKLEIRILSKNHIIINYSTTYSEIQDDPTISLKFNCQTDDDASLVQAYESLPDIPCYLVKTVPQLMSGEALVQEGSEPVFLGEDIRMSVTAGLQSSPSSKTFSVISGGIYTLTWACGLSPATFLKQGQRLESIKSEMEHYIENPGNGFSVGADKLTASFNASIGIMYWSELLLFDKYLTSAYGVSKINQEMVSLSAPTVDRSNLYGVAVSINTKGFYIDVGMDTFSLEAATSFADMKQYCLARGMTSSSLEGQVMELLFGLEGISSMRILQIASNSNIPIYIINNDNQNICIGGLTTENYIKEHIKSLVSQGYQVACPQRLIQYKGYSGIGYMAFDQNTGSCGFFISGGNAGGASLCSMTPPINEDPNSPDESDSAVEDAGNIAFWLIVAGLIASAWLAWGNPAPSAIAKCFAAVTAAGAAYYGIQDLLKGFGTGAGNDGNDEIEITMIMYFISGAFQSLVAGALFGSFTANEPAAALCWAQAGMFLSVAAIVFCLAAPAVEGIVEWFTGVI